MKQPFKEVVSVLQQINARHCMTFTIQKRFSTGWQGGAYALINEKKEQFVLKWYHAQPHMLHRVERARQITNTLHEQGAPVPVTYLIDTFSDGSLAWITTALPGVHTNQFSEHQLKHLLSLNELQVGQAISLEQNWTTYTKNVVFANESGWTELLRRYSSTSGTLLMRLEQLVAGKQEYCQRACDIVHGDCNFTNLLVENEKISGIVDWDATGCGDRFLDLFPLLFDAYAYKNTIAYWILHAYLLSQMNYENLIIYTAYQTLVRVSWAITKYDPADIVLEINRASAIITDIETALL